MVHGNSLLGATGLARRPSSHTLNIAKIEHKATPGEDSREFESNLLLQLVRMGFQTINGT
jgi:hypothetical protein